MSPHSFEKRQIDCIAVPMTAREVGALPILFFIWKLYELINEKNSVEAARPSLVITLPNGDKAPNSYIYRLFSVYKLETLFADIQVHNLSIADEDDIYIRDPETYKGSIPRLGLKSGPNNQFFETMRKCSGFGCTLLNEVDMLPVRSNWLEQISMAVPASGHFFAVGSRYSGEQKLGPDIARHINGNAIYNTGSPIFREFLDMTWEPGVERMCKDMPDTAYDIWFSRLYHRCMGSEFRDLSSSEFRHLQAYDQMFISTSIIANLLPTDLLWHHDISLHISNGVSLLHGKTAPAICLQLAFNELRDHDASAFVKDMCIPPMSSRLFISLSHAHSDARVVSHLKKNLHSAQTGAIVASPALSAISALMEVHLYQKIIEDLLASEIYSSFSIPEIADLAPSDAVTTSNLFAFSPYKSGGTLLFNGLQLLAGEDHLNVAYKSYYDESYALHGDTVEWLNRSDHESLFSSPSCIYGGFRDADPFTAINQGPVRVDVTAKAKALPGNSQFIFLFRDPRDCLVSLYFSHLRSHTTTSSLYTSAAAINAAKMSIDRRVIETTASCFHNFAQIVCLLERVIESEIPFQVFAYEQIYSNQHSMFRKICSSMNYDLNYQRWNQLVNVSRISANPLDVHPTSEDNARNIRKGTPGDHKIKLSENTIKLINKPLKPLLEFMQAINPHYNYLE
jgi:hypothetical protein